MLVDATIGRLAVGCVLAVAMPFVGGCGACKYDRDDLPVVLCDPVPAGSPGCVGVPGEAENASNLTYPPACQVYSASRAMGRSASCGYSSFVCVKDVGTKHIWIIPL